MMTHDPFQNYQSLGAYAGAATPFGLPFNAYQTPFNPTGIAAPLQSHPGIGGYGISPNPFQGVAPLQQLLALNALINGMQNPILQHLQTQTPWQNPLLAAGLQNPQAAYHNWAQQQQQPNYPLAPQTLLGAGGIGQPFAQQFGYPGQIPGQIPGLIHPRAQLALRQAYGYGGSPIAGCF